VAVDDPDGDPLTVSWTITRGSPLTANGASVAWTAPSAVGVDTIRVSVTDGSVTRSITEEIRVCWPTGVAPAVFQKQRSPYIINLGASTTLSVDEGAESTIEAGTEILLDTPGTVIDVAGRLVSLGTDTEHVVIRPNLRHPDSDDRGWWEGIRCDRASGASTAGRIELDYTEVWYGQDGLRLLDDATAVLDGCAVRRSGSTGILHEGTGALELTDTEVSNGRVHGIVIGSDVSTVLPDSVLINGCDIKFNESTGLIVSIDDQLEEIPITVEFTKFEFNFIRAITLARSSFPEIHFNHFSGNGVGSGISNIYLEDGYPGPFVTRPTLNARCNFWGSAISNEATITGTIRDAQDSPGLVGTQVDVNPWLNESPLTTPPTCTP
jgi:hypothetical protein